MTELHTTRVYYEGVSTKTHRYARRAAECGTVMGSRWAQNPLPYTGMQTTTLKAIISVVFLQTVLIIQALS